MLENGDLKSAASKKLTISFAGGGFLAGAYHLGVVLCLQECAPQFLSRIERFFGTSCGAMIAAWAACGLKIEILYKSLLQNVEELCSSYRMKSLNPTFDFYARMYRLFDAHFPQDVHRKLRGRFMTSMTSVPAFRSVYVSNFNTRKELFNGILTSCFFPGFTQMHCFPVFRGKTYMDGGFTANLPGWPDTDVICVSPFHGGCDIGPVGSSASPYLCTFAGFPFQVCLENLFRLRIVFVPRSVEELEGVVREGYQDTLKFLKMEGVRTEHPPERCLWEAEKSTTSRSRGPQQKNGHPESAIVHWMLCIQLMLLLLPALLCLVGLDWT